jgi:hypothetical protein
MPRRQDAKMNEKVIKYLRLKGLKLGFLLNFGIPSGDGWIKRVVILSLCVFA